LRAYVASGGTLVVSGPVPGRDERGAPLAFLPADRFVGSGYLAQEAPEEERLESIAFVADLVARCVPAPHVRLTPAEPVNWVDWRPGGGAGEFRQPRNLGSAILHRGPHEALLFVLNHYPEAARFVVELADGQAVALDNLFTGERVPLAAGRAELDLDRKSGEVYRVVGSRG
jgi:hypothetical protein